MIKKFFMYQKWEFQRDRSLMLLAGLLSLVLFAWNLHWRREDLLDPNSFFVPWPFFEGQMLEWLPSLRRGLLTSSVLLLILSLIASFFFFLGRAIIIGWCLFFVSLLFFAAIYFTDYQLKNQDLSSLLILSVCLLFLPNKTRVLKLLMISFWIMTSWSWMQSAWIGGEWFEQNWQLHPKIGEWCAAVFCITLAIAPTFLLYKKAKSFWPAWLTVASCLALVFFKEGFLSVAPSLALLIFFATHWFEKRKQANDFVYQNYIHPEPSQLWPAAALVVFWTPQGLPYLIKEPSKVLHYLSALEIKAEGSSLQCEAELFVGEKGKVRRLVFPTVRSLEPCNPYYYFIAAKSVCDNKQTKKDLVNIHFFFRSQNALGEFSNLATSKLCEEDFYFQQLRDSSNGI